MSTLTSPLDLDERVLAALGDDEPFDVATMALSPVDEIEDEEEGEAKAYADAEADADEDDEPAIQAVEVLSSDSLQPSCATSAAPSCSRRPRRSSWRSASSAATCAPSGT